MSDEVTVHSRLGACCQVRNTEEFGSERKTSDVGKVVGLDALRGTCTGPLD